ncbi:MAG: hypothetical protein ACJ789_20085 [Thermomicrobiales bacterium]
MKRFAALMLALALAALIGRGFAGAQDATPAAGATPSGFFGFPDPSECTVAPKSIGELQSILATPVAATPAAATPTASPVTTAMPAGTPADATTVAEVQATLRETVACINTGQILKVVQFYSDDLLRSIIAGYPLEQLQQGTPVAGTPVPLPQAQQTELIGISGMVVTPDGRVAVVVTGDNHAEPSPPSDTLFYFVKVGDKWLVDDFVTDVNVATPAP